MDWNDILSHLTVSRLSKLALNAGLAGMSRRRKSQLVTALHGELDDALKEEALSLFTGVELQQLVLGLGIPVVGTRKQQLVTMVMAHDEEDQELELSEHDFMIPDRSRLDLPQGHNVHTNVEVVPVRPGAADSAVLFEVQALLRRPTLSRAIIVARDCNSSVLCRLLGEGLDDLIESAVRWRASTRDDRALITVILDGEHHGLGDGDAGKTLVSLAMRLRGRLEVRLAPSGQQLRASVLAFEESRRHGPYCTAFVGASSTQEAVPKPPVEANVRVAGPLESLGNATSLVKEWVAHLARDSRSLTDKQLAALPSLDRALRKLDYKLDFDTAHELRLKYLAEQLCRRGRWASPMFDSTVLEEPPTHQHVAVARAAEPWRDGCLLFDENGLGKTIEAGLILSRELRRRRVYASSDSVERRRALIVAPTSMHNHWREELAGKFGLEAEVASAYRFGADELSSWHAGEAQIVICGPGAAAAHWEDMQGFEILLVDEAHLYDEDVLAAISGIRAAAELCIVASGTPVQDDISDVLLLAELAMPAEAWDSFASIGDHELFGEELRQVSTRARRAPLLKAGRLAAREMVDKFYDLEDDEADAYVALREMRFDYLRRGGHERASAFLALEQTFLSSLAAFHATACRLIGDGPRDDADLLPRVAGDRSFAFFRASSYFRRRLRRVRELLAHRCRPEAGINAKEAALLEILSQNKHRPVVVFTSYRATQQRIVAVLERAKLRGVIEPMDGESSLRERFGTLARFQQQTGEARKGDSPSGVLICTDKAVEELGLQRTAGVLVNYDLPWNPQQIERRIARLHRWGQSDRVQVFNVAARNPKAKGWTMDNRVLQASRGLFGMAEADVRANDALFEVEPSMLAARLASDDAGELSLIAEPDSDVVAQLDDLFVGGPDPMLLAAVETAQMHDRRYRQQLAEFWSHVAPGQERLAGVCGDLFSRLQLGLLQGSVGVLCAPDRDVASCSTFHVAVGLRLLFESARHEAGGEPMDDDWLVEDEVPYLWAVSPEGQLVDWSEFLMSGGLVEVPRNRAAKLVGREVLDYLVAEKRAIETRDLDAVPFAAWRRKAPAGVDDKLAIAGQQAEALASARLVELQNAWDLAKAQRLARLERRRAGVEGVVNESVLADIDAACDTAREGRVKLRHQILGTQLFLILH